MLQRVPIISLASPSGITPSSGSGFEEVEPEDCITMVQLAIQKCLEKESLCNEFYLQLVKQTTDQPGRGTDHTSRERYKLLSSLSAILLSLRLLLPRS